MKIEPTLRFSPPLLVPLLLVVLFSSCSSSPSESSVLWRSNAKLLQLMQQFPQFVGVLPEARLTRHQVPHCCCYFLLIFACDMTWSSPLWSLSPIDSLPCWGNQSVHCHHTDHLLHHCLSLDSNLVTIYQSLTLISSTNEHLLTLLQPVIWGKQIMWP